MGNHCFPEVETVFGTIGRSDSATDNAPLGMYDTTIMLKPREKWRTGMTYEKLIQEMAQSFSFQASRIPGRCPLKTVLTWSSRESRRLLG